MNADMHDSIRRLTVKYADCKSSIRHVCDVLTALHRLEWLEIQNPDGRFCTINGILYSRNGKSLYFCPREREGSVRVQEGTEVICKNAFSATNISELIIPDSVKRIQEFACGDNHVLEKVIGGKGIVSFGQYAFFNCVKLTELSLGKNIKLIGNAAFTNTGLKNVDLPEGLKSVGGGAFHTVHITEDSYMVGVEPEGMYEVHIPKSLKKIGCCAFANASVVYAENVNRKLLMACVQSGNMQRYHVARFWRLKVKDKPELILPKNIESPELAAQEINEFLNTDGGKIPHLYKYGRGNTTLAAALEHCRLYTDRQTKAFLTRHASKIAGIYSGEVEEFAKYIHAGVFTNIALKKMFAELEVNKKERDDLTVLKASSSDLQNAFSKIPFSLFNLLVLISIVSFVSKSGDSDITFRMFGNVRFDIRISITPFLIFKVVIFGNSFFIPLKS